MRMVVLFQCEGNKCLHHYCTSVKSNALRQCLKCGSVDVEPFYFLEED